jgi:hypothetical protein
MCLFVSSRKNYPEDGSIKFLRNSDTHLVSYGDYGAVVQKELRPTYIDANQIPPRTFGVDSSINFLRYEFLYCVNEIYGQMNQLYLHLVMVWCHIFNVMTMGDKSLLICFSIVIFCLCSEQLVIPVFDFRGDGTTT